MISVRTRSTLMLSVGTSRSPTDGLPIFLSARTASKRTCVIAILADGDEQLGNRRFAAQNPQALARVPANPVLGVAHPGPKRRHD